MSHNTVAFDPKFVEGPGLSNWIVIKWFHNHGHNTDGTRRSTCELALAVALNRTNQDENSIKEDDDEDEESEDEENLDDCGSMLEDKCPDSETQ